MKLRLTWEEFTDLAMRQLREVYAGANNPTFLRDYGPYGGGIRGAYEIPNYVDVELEKP